MKIKNIRKTYEGAYVKISATCTLRYFGDDEIYFKIHKKYEDFIFLDASPFAAALLIPSMRKGEDLIIEGSISQQLYDGMYQAMTLLTSWDDLQLKPIKIKAQNITKDTQKSTYIASFFSGGVDSFYTYLKHKKTADGKLSHFILVNGYDIDLRNKKLWETTKYNVEKIAKKEQVEVIEIESNLQPLLEPIMVWDYTFVGGLSAVALLLRNKIKKVYRPSSYNYENLIGSNDMVIEKYLSTEKISIIHDGAEASRIDKVKKIAHSQLVLDTLRVCYLNIKDTYNCGTCDKCLRTMIGLQIAGVLDKAKTFPNHINIDLVRKISIDNKHGVIFHKENLAELKKLHKEKQLQEAIQQCLNAFSTKPMLVAHIIATGVYIDYLFNRSHVYHFISRMRNKL